MQIVLVKHLCTVRRVQGRNSDGAAAADSEAADTNGEVVSASGLPNLFTE